MSQLIDDLKDQARALHKQVQAAQPAALGRVRALRELRDASDSALAAETLRRQCLAVIARELGFDGWPHLVAVIEGKRDDDFGTLLYKPGHWNIWSASYDEARTIRAEHGGYLLPYKHQFVIVDRYFIETLGLDPDDADWEAIGRDWVKPGSMQARERLYAKLIRLQLAGET
jgi:hypothetical protein